MHRAAVALLSLGSATAPQHQQLPVSAVVSLAPADTPAPDELLRVAAVQTTNFDDGKLRSAAEEIADKTMKVVSYIHRAAELGAEIAVFPEMVLTR